MLGDFRLWIRKVWKQFKCDHDYKIVHALVFDHHSYKECTKCDRTKGTW